MRLRAATAFTRENDGDCAPGLVRGREAKEVHGVGNVFRVFARDVKRLAKAPASWLVIIFLAVLPSLYTWFNVVGFWNPYSNTGELSVCVVNEDAGASDEVLGDLELGDQIIEALEENDQLGWEFTTRDEAMSRLEAGDTYAVFVIPKDFSSNMCTLLSSEFIQPQLEYYVNEKTGPVAPKITDTGASTLDTTINDTFVETVSQTVAQQLNDALAESQASLDDSKNKVTDEIDAVQSDLSDARASIQELSNSSADAISKTSDAKGSLAASRQELGTMALALSQASALSSTLMTDLGSFTGSMGTALDQGSSLISSASSQASQAIGQAAGNISAAQGDVDAAAKYGQAVVDNNTLLIAQLQTMLDDATLTDEQRAALQSTIDALTASNANAQTQINNLQALSADVTAAANDVSAASDTVNKSVQATIAATDAYRNTLSGSTIPAVSGGLGSISAAAGSLSGTVTAQASLIDQTSLVLDQLASTLTTTSDALGQTDSLIADVQGDIDTVRVDVAALGTSSALGQLFGEDGAIDVEKVSDFMSSPTQLVTEELYPLNAYGSAMSPLFINLTLWIGVFMLMVIMHIEVDDEGIKRLTIWQRFLGRGLLFAILVSIQAAICVTGCLALGVQTASVPLLYLTAILCSLTYLSIQYTLSTTLQHVGKGLCVILVFVQIPGATGLYPVELTTSFFQAVYPAFPFTYGINAMRECISGFYGNELAFYVGILFLFWLIFLLIGVFARPFLTNLNRMFAKQLAESDIINHEQVQLPERRYRMTQIIRAMSDHDEFRDYLEERSSKFMRLYPKLKRWAIVTAVIVPIIFTALVAFVSPGQKVIILTGWLIWLIAVILFLIILEHARYSLDRQAKLNNMNDEELASLFAARNSLDPAPALASEQATKPLFRPLGKHLLGGFGLKRPATAAAGVAAVAGDSIDVSDVDAIYAANLDSPEAGRKIQAQSADAAALADITDVPAESLMDLNLDVASIPASSASIASMVASSPARAYPRQSDFDYSLEAESDFWSGEPRKATGQLQTDEEFWTDAPAPGIIDVAGSESEGGDAR